MNENNNENIDSKIDDVEEVGILADDATDEEKADHYAKLEDSNKQLYVRLQKAKGNVLVNGKWIKPEAKPLEKPIDTTKDTSKDNLTQADLYTLIKANVPEEDLPEVIEYATLKKISVADALKSSVVKSILANNAEERNVANGTNTDGGKRGNAKLSDNALLANADKGILPESDADMARLIALQRASRR